MANFDASSIISAGRFKAGTLQSLLEDELPGRGPTDTDTSSRSHTSGSFTDLHTSSETVESDEVIMVHFNARVSASAANLVIGFKWVINSTSRDPIIYWESVSGSTSSDRGHINHVFQIGSLSGSIPFNMQWQLYSGSGTIYCTYSNIFFDIRKQRA